MTSTRHGPVAAPAAPSRRALGRQLGGLALGGLLPGLGAGSAFGQQGRPAEAYPTHPVRFVINGGADQLARLVAEEMTAHYGQAVYVETKVGAAGAMATDFMLKAPPDGYNWLLTSVSFTGQTILQKKPAALLPVTMIATFPFVLVVNNDLPVHSVPELVARARAQPGKLNFASAGVGAPGHLSVEMLRQMAGIDMLHIPYQGVGKGLVGVMGNEVQLMFVPAPAALSLIKSGKVRPIAVSTAQRYGQLPEVPTVAEQGYPDYLYVSWNGIHAAPGTPPALLDRIAHDVSTTINTPAMKARAEAAGFDVVDMDRPAFTAFMQADLARVGKVIRAGNITAG